MSERNFQCTNLANCDKALAHSAIAVMEGEELLCPECGAKLVPMEKPKRPALSYVVAIAAAALLFLGVGGYVLLHGKMPSRQTSGKTIPPVPSPVAETPAYPCGLKPVPVSNAARMLQYLKQGMNYASQKKPDLAINEFEQLLRSDPNFLGVQMNIGAAQLALRKYPEAEAAFNQELKIIGCLKQMNDEQLEKFAYMQEAGIGIEANSGKELQRASLLRSRLDRAEANVHYNIACLASLQQQNGRAMTELEKALAGGLIDKKMLQTDPDLQGVRRTAEFKKLMARYSPALAALRSSP